MPNKPKARGTAAETAVVRALRALGFPHAERRALAGVHDLGDITGTPGLCWEVKGGDAARTASDNQITDWLTETEKERANAGADHGILVVQRKAIGAANAHRWWAILNATNLAELLVNEGAIDWGSGTPTFPVRMLLGDACHLLRAAGYGQPLPEAAAC